MPHVWFLRRLALFAALAAAVPARSMTRSVVTALAAAKGDAKLAEALLNLDDDWIARIEADER